MFYFLLHPNFNDQTNNRHHRSGSLIPLKFRVTLCCINISLSNAVDISFSLALHCLSLTFVSSYSVLCNSFYKEIFTKMKVFIALVTLLIAGAVQAGDDANAVPLQVEVHEGPSPPFQKYGKKHLIPWSRLQSSWLVVTSFKMSHFILRTLGSRHLARTASTSEVILG